MNSATLLLCLLAFSSQYGLIQNAALLSPWKMLMNPLFSPALAPPPAPGAAAGGSAGDPAAGSTSPVAYSPMFAPYPGLWNLYGIPPFAFMPGADLGAPSNETTAYTQALLSAWIEKQKIKAEAKAAKKLAKATTTEPTIGGMGVSQLTELLQNILEPSTTTEAPFLDSD